MKHWTNVCVEGHCFAEEDEDGNNPCGRNVPAPFCLGTGRTGICPHFAWSDATERDASRFVPIRLIVKDRTGVWVEEGWDKLHWWFWGQLWFNQRKVREFFDKIPIEIAENNPIITKMKKKTVRVKRSLQNGFRRLVKRH